jgi:hypothetical protein
MLAERVAPASDELGVFLALLDHLRDVRVSAKRLARTAAEAEERRHQHAMQQTFKILINAFYGYLAFGSGHFNDFAAADRVTTEGRRVVTAIVDRLTELGATPIEATPTASTSWRPPGHLAADDAALLETIAAGLPEGIALELDARHAAMLSYKMKTYALLDARGRVQLKGSGFRSRGLEPFQRRLIEEVVRLLLEGKRVEVRPAIDRWLTAFATIRSRCASSRAPTRCRTRSMSIVERVRPASARPRRPTSWLGHRPRLSARRSDLVLRRRAQSQRGGQRDAPSGARVGSARPGRERGVLPGQGAGDLGSVPALHGAGGLALRDESAEDEAQLSLF